MAPRLSLALVIAASLNAFVAFAQDRVGSDDIDPAAKDEIGQKFVIYDDRPSAFISSGWMPDGKGISMDEKHKDGAFSGRFCARWQYSVDKQPERWVSAAYLYKGKWFGPKFDLFGAIGAKKGDEVVLRFYARSSTKSFARFEFGGGEGSSMSFPADRDWVQISPEWKRYEINLTDQDLSKIGKSFSWIMDEDNNDASVKVHELQLDRIYVTRVVRKPLE